MMTFGHIYGLADPRTGEIRYVGFSTNVIKRCAWHRDACSSDVDGHRAHWLKSLRRDGLRCSVLILQAVAEHEWQEAEKWWIVFLRSQGHELTNLTDGGEGTRGHVFSDEQRQKVGEASKKAWTPERRARHSEFMKGNSYGFKRSSRVAHSQETREKMKTAARSRARVCCVDCRKETSVSNSIVHSRHCTAKVI